MDGSDIPCYESGQDGEYKIGVPWPSPRFKENQGVVHDLLTGLTWTRNANPIEFPLTWEEALTQVNQWNAESFLGFTDWRLPNRREMRSLMGYQEKKPSLPTGHPFTNIFLNWYWTSTTSAINPAYAWYVHLEGARMFYGKKDQQYLLWPVRGAGNCSLLQTGQQKCYDCKGREAESKGSGQDGEFCYGKAWPSPRFEVNREIVRDCLTGLHWSINADLTGKPVDWKVALNSIKQLNADKWLGKAGWRLPNINELESLVDSSAHSPALPLGHPFKSIRESYWSSTTSYFETDWAWVLYMHKGACGVGYKPGSTFYVWSVF